MQIDIELAFVDASGDDLMGLQNSLPSGYYIEDRSERGWGLVLRSTAKSPDIFDDAINAFLEPFALNKLIEEAIRKHKGIMRAGIFYNTATCSFQLNSYDNLNSFGVPLDISIYPSYDE